MEIPQCRIDGVVLGRFAAVRKPIRQHPLTCMRGESPQDRSRLRRAAGAEREAGQRNHRVAAPVAEPGITGDDCRAGGLSGRARAPHDERIGRERELPDPRRGRLRGSAQQRAAASQFPLERAGSGFRRLGFRANAKGDRLAGREPRPKHAGPEQVLQRIESALGLEAMAELPVPLATGAKLAAVDAEPIGPCTGKGGDGAAGGVRIDRERPAAVRVRVIVAVGAKRQQLEIQGPRSPAAM